MRYAPGALSMAWRALAVVVGLGLLAAPAGMALAVGGEVECGCDAPCLVRFGATVTDISPCPSALEALMIGNQPGGVPAPNRIDDVFDIVRRFERGGVEESVPVWDDATTLNAIALSRGGGSPLGADDVAGRDMARSRSVAAVQVLIIEAEDVLTALLLGTPRVDYVISNLPFLRRFSVEEQGLQRRDLGEDEAFSGLTLRAAGIPFENRDLVTTRDEYARDSRFAARTLGGATGGAGIPREAILAAAAVGTFREPLPLFSASTSRDLVSGLVVSSERDVALPPGRALMGAALANAGISVNGADMVDVREREIGARGEAVAWSLSAADALAALTLGLRVS